MNMKEYQEKVLPGTRVFIEVAGNRYEGTAGRMFAPEGITFVIKFDTGIIGKVTEETVGMIQLVPSN